MTAQTKPVVAVLAVTFVLACTGIWQALPVGVAAVNAVWFIPDLVSDDDA